MPRAWPRFTLVLFLSLLVACGARGTAAPKGPDNLVVGAGRGSAPVAAAANEAAPEDDGPVPIAADDPVRGPRNAYVTIVVFSDFQCPFCSRFTATLDQIQETYGEDVRIVFKNEPLSFHKHAQLAAEVGHAVFALKGNDAFWRFHDMAFRRQQLMSEDAIRAWAISAGADSREVEDGLTRKKWAEKVDRDMAVAKALGVTGTPASFVNGIEVSGAQPFDKFKEIIDAELERAKDLVARGVARDRVYGRLSTMNFHEKPARRGVDDPVDDPPDTTVWKVPVGTSPVRGNGAALVTIVEFSDFQCPYCKRVEPTLERVLKEYGARVRLVWKDEPLPFHPRAVPAAQLARAARAQKGDGGFWSVHDKLFDSQPKLDDPDLEAVARAGGLDVAKAMGAVKNKSFAKAIDDDAQLGDDVQASGTPHFFINGRRLVGAQPYDKFKEMIDAEIVKAEALVRGGTPAAAVYETIIKNGKAAPEPEKKSVASAASAPFRGAANAKVVIQEFSDFQCPFCNRVEPTLDELLKAYPGKVKIVWRNLPLTFHADAELAAEAAREAFAQKGNEGFSKYRELLFKNQSDLKRPALEAHAATVGLDLGKFGKALDGHVHLPAIEADKKAASDAGIAGTPAFVVGAYFLSGAQPVAKFKKLIERALAEPAPSPQPVQQVVPSQAAAMPAGLVVKDAAIGTGREVKKGDKVKVHYVGKLTDGTEFDSSRKHGQPFEFEVGQGAVIKGWDAGLVGMKVGGKRKLTIPPDLAYGDRGMPPTIPPKSTLVFDIELLSIQ